jgi:hypothetical protein
MQPEAAFDATLRTESRTSDGNIHPHTLFGKYIMRPYSVSRTCDLYIILSIITGLST